MEWSPGNQTPKINGYNKTICSPNFTAYFCALAGKYERSLMNESHENVHLIHTKEQILSIDNLGFTAAQILESHSAILEVSCYILEAQARVVLGPVFPKPCQYKTHLNFVTIDYLNFVTIDHLNFVTIDHLNFVTIDHYLQYMRFLKVAFT